MLLLIDANSLIHRCYHALPPLTNKKGDPTGALYGVANILLKISSQTKPEYCAALFDRPEPTFRKERFSDYKIHRKKAEDDLITQIKNAHELFESFSIKTFELAGYEADDLIGTFAKKFSKETPVRILTGDLDSLQLIRDSEQKIDVETFRRGISDTIVYKEKEVFERYGLKPEQLIDYKGLVGDASDNIPGVRGVGPKTASEILQKYKTLDNFLLNGEKEKQYKRIVEEKEIAMLSKELATINCNAPIETTLKDLKFSLDEKNILDFFKRNDFSTLVKKLEIKENITEDKEVGTEEKIIKQLIGSDHSLESYEKEIDSMGLKKVWEEIEKPLIPIIKEMEDKGICVDLKKLNELEKRLTKEINEKETEIRKILGSININSPKQLLEKLNNDFNLKIKSTSADVLLKVRNAPKVIDDILSYRELFKLQTTYVKPLSELIQKDGRIHPTFIQIGAATGRLACQNPNLQNIPQESKWSPEIRDAFIAEKDSLLVSLDYSQIELRVLAHLSGDENMRSAFLEGKDIHSRTASLIFDVPEKDVTKQMRRTAKTLNFGIIYGMGSRAFAQSSGISLDEAKKFIEKYFEEFSMVKKWQEEILRETRKNGFVRNENGRIRSISNINSKNQFLASEAQRAAINMPTQSLAADILKLAMIHVYNFIRRNYAKDAHMILTVHDELIFEIKSYLLEKDCGSRIVDEIKEIMESAYNLSVPLIVSSSIGKTWKELR